MTWFSHRVRSSDVVRAPREEIWDVLSDPDLLARMVSRVDRIEADGDRWCWVLRGIDALGIRFEPSFTEQMRFEDQRTIEFTHAPQGSRERAAADGRYDLADAEDGTEVSIDITLKVDLPLPRAMRPAVEGVMAREMDRTGDHFADQLRRLVDAG